MLTSKVSPHDVTMFYFVTKIRVYGNHLSNVCEWPYADQFQISCDKQKKLVWLKFAIYDLQELVSI